MAVLSDSERGAVWERWMRENGEPCSISKADLRAAVNALDDWLNTNAITINLAIPQPARGALTNAQKARLLTFVVERRYITGA